MRLKIRQVAQFVLQTQALVPSSRPPPKPRGRRDGIAEPLGVGLGGAISYLLNHWHRLALFLRQAGAPIDNNVCERALKKAILHRKNSLFYKTDQGAEVGDLFMSLVHTAELCGANPFDYLTQLQRHAHQLKESPAQWMPWNYTEMLQPSAASVDSG